MQRRVRLSYTEDGAPVIEDMGAWICLRGNDHDSEGHDTGPEPEYAVAPDDLNTSVRYGWRPLPSPPT